MQTTFVFIRRIEVAQIKTVSLNYQNYKIICGVEKKKQNIFCQDEIHMHAIKVYSKQ